MKETSNKTKRLPTQWETFQNNIFDKGSIFKIYKELIQVNIKKQNKTKQNKTKKKQIWKSAEDLKRHLSKDTDDQQAHEKIFNATNYREIQIKTTVSPHTCQNGYHQKDNK